MSDIPFIIFAAVVWYWVYSGLCSVKDHLK